MSPIVTTMGAPAGRARRVKAPSGGGGGGGGSGSTGPGPNAPSWSGKTVYTEESFASNVPASPAAANSAGFRGFSGFSGVVAGGARVEYPTVSTPLGSKRVMQINYYGQTETLGALDAVTTPFAFGSSGLGYYRASVAITGTWVGTLSFEDSTDNGVTWNPVTLTGARAAAPLNFTPSNASSTTSIGCWKTSASSGDNRLLRVRMSSYTSGSATVRVGFLGGAAAANFNAGNFTGSPTRIYYRMLWRRSAGWSNGVNTGTKLFFFSQISPNKTNHYVNSTVARIGLQGHIAPPETVGSENLVPADGEWIDMECIFEGGTAGGSDGICRIWCNNVLVLESTNERYFPSDVTPVFTNIYCDPTYGGGEGPPPQNQYFQFAYVYRESAA